jgi:NHLM bacteriocin system ABC transporter ATP-binding protein
VKLARVADAKDDGDLCSAVAVAAENWVSILSAVLTAARQIPTTTEVMDEGQVTHLEPGRMVRAGARPVWVFQSVGTGRLMGRDDFPAVGKGCYVPLCGNLWLEAIEASELHAFSLSDLLRRGIDLRECLQVLHQCVCEFVRSQRGETASRERIHLVSSIEQEQVLAQSTYGYLSEVLGKAFTGPQTTTQDTLFDACQIIGQTLGLKILQPQSSARHLAMDEALLNISGASGLRTRRVKLKGQWWKDDHGPLLCTLSASGVPVALLPDRAGYYELLEPSSGARTRVDSTVAATLDLTAYVFYRPFPEGQLKPLSLLLFGLVGSWSDLRLIAWLAIGAGLVATFVPIATGVLYDSVIPSAEKTLLLQMVAGLAVGSFVGGIFQLVQGLAQLRFLGRLEASLEAAVWDRLLNLPVTFFRRFSSGDLATRAASIYQIQQAVSGAVLSSLLAGFFCVFNISLLFYYGPILGFVAMAILVVSGAVMSALFALQLRYQRPQLDLDGKISGFNIQILTSIAKIRVSAAERRAMEKWSILYSHLKALRVKFRKVGMVSAIFQASLPLVLTLAIFAVLAQIWDPDDPSIPTGRFLAFTAALTAVISGVMTAVGNLAEVLAVKPMYDRMRPILEEEPETRGSRKDPGRLSGSIEMAHVNFRYKPDGPLILKDVSLKADPGEFIALVGPSGSGKSTILRLLIRFEFPESGSIFYDGQRLADLDIQAVRRQLGVVLQGGRLLSGSIYESIAGGFQLTMEDALEAARMAALAQDIEAMPMGMHTAIGEGGAGLSGGQRQRLLIARAIVRRPKIVLFDEATSALDNIGQEQVSRSLEGLQATRIVIAHRLSTVRNADRIYVIVRGQIVESGSYDELMAMEGVFSQLAKRQIA